ERSATDADLQWLLPGELILDPGARVIAIAEDPRPMRASVHQTILANILPVVGDDAADERDPQTGAHQVRLDAAVEGDQAGLVEGQRLRLLVCLQRVVPAGRGSALVQCAL